MKSYALCPCISTFQPHKQVIDFDEICYKIYDIGGNLNLIL